jgi:hypothetical protein
MFFSFLFLIDQRLGAIVTTTFPEPTGFTATALKAGIVGLTLDELRYIEGPFALDVPPTLYVVKLRVVAFHICHWSPTPGVEAARVGDVAGMVAVSNVTSVGPGFATKVV